ncbi:MAG: primosomal protein N' [Ignavibacteria bacterium]|nr:primosomal protein N' [Ignavibacteria bacterium]
MKNEYVNVALNIPVNKVFTYKIPDNFIDIAEPGLRILVKFGNKEKTGIITDFTDMTELKYVKEFITILDDVKILTHEIMKFCKWMSDYYVAPIGEVLFSVIPGNINIKSDVYYSLNEEYEERINSFKISDNIIFDIIDLFKKDFKTKLTSGQIESRLNYKNLSSKISLMKSENILLSESLYSKPVKEKFVKIISNNFENENLEEVISENNIKSSKQIEILKTLSGIKETELNEFIKLNKFSLSPINTLHKKNLIVISEKRKIRESEEIFSEEHKEIVLTAEQSECLIKIKNSLQKGKFKSYMLYGVTGSGKTEIYINSIKEVLKYGKSALVLVPEISLTPQLIHRFRKNFKERIGIIHSKIPDGEKFDTLHGICSGEIKIVIGARSALFAPLKNIGLIVVDEEHDSSYKQENSPRYNGRDSAVYRAMLNSAVVILGSATPSFESYHNAVSGKFELLSLPLRATSINMPEIEIVDLLKKEIEEEDVLDFFKILDKQIRVKFLSKDLIFEIGKRLEKKESVIILQNRRGYHAYIECHNCGKVEMCPRCNISLTFHKAFNLMKCHYCGFSRKFDGICSSCGSTFLIPMGAGTERVEEELMKIFPRAIIKRMDSDVLTSKKQFQQILKDFYDKKIDILTGTQLISKGLDFPEVTLVGVVNADIGLLNPDFRATEKTFQILTQVSGRSGRSYKKGEVLIQTNHSDYFVFDKIKNHDYKGFYEQEIKFREKLNYPPFSRLAIIESKSADKNQSESKIKEIYNLIKKLDVNKKIDLLTPSVPLFSKLKDKYRFHLIVRSNKKTDTAGNYLTEILRNVRDYSGKYIPKNVLITIDMDAINLL